MKKLLTLTLTLLCIGFLSAQDKTYTMKDAVLGSHTNLKPDNLKQLSWIPGKHAFTKLKDKALVKVSVPGMKEENLFSLADINAQLSDVDDFKKMPSIKWFDAAHIYFKHGDVFYRGDASDGNWNFHKWVELPKGETNYYVDKEKKQLAYSKGNNLYLADADGKSLAVTDNKDDDIVSGQIVSRQEFGIDRGVFFSPKGNYLAFYRKDESQVDDYPVIDWDTVPAKNKPVKYPMAGKKSQEIWLGIYSPKTGKTVYMKTGRHTDHYLTNVTWGPKENYIYIAILERSQKQLTLNKYDVETGEKTATLFEEKDDKYVHPAEPLYFIPGHDDQFIWWSERDGFMHLYRYNTDGKLLNKVTSGDWVVNSIDGWLPQQKEIIISSSKRSPMDKTLYAVNWENGKIRPLNDTPGMHTAKVSSDGNYWIDSYSNYNIPRKIIAAKTHGKWEKELLTADNPLKEYKKPEIKELTITAADGKTPLYARMILPPDFDKNKKYPVIVYLYNGPGIQLLHHSFPESGNLWYDYMAQHGYIIFTMDGRGSSNRGLDFEQVTYRHLGTHEMEDQLKGVGYLKSLPYVDADRLGVHGWSFGGFMTTSLMLRHPGVFKVAVAGGPVIDWRMYEIMYTERYMDRPQDNPEGYAESGLLDKVENLKGKLLIIHGAQDSTVVWQHSMRFLHACIQHNVQLDYFVYPAHPHNVRGKDRVHLMQKITDYFDEFLK